MSWRVYYDDGSHSDNEVTEPFRVIAIVQPRESTGREVLNAYPYYLLWGGRWRPVEDLPSLVQQVMYHAGEIQAAAMGVLVDDEEYHAIIKAAMTDPGLPARSARDRDRRR